MGEALAASRLKMSTEVERMATTRRNLGVSRAHSMYGPYGWPHGYHGYYGAYGAYPYGTAHLTKETSRVLANEQFLFETQGMSDVDATAPYYHYHPWRALHGYGYPYGWEGPATEPPAFYNYTLQELKAMKAAQQERDLLASSGVKHAEYLTDRAESHLRWSRLYGRGPLSSSADLEAANAVAADAAKGAPVSPAQRIRASMHCD